ncbi:hypothetical protein AnigIFM56816_011051 [Aspergillus niger]|nr:hypothetical protein AnigIFM56816_011051 [Aspergillus niger]
MIGKIKSPQLLPALERPAARPRFVENHNCVAQITPAAFAEDSKGSNNGTDTVPVNKPADGDTDTENEEGNSGGDLVVIQPSWEDK